LSHRPTFLKVEGNGEKKRGKKKKHLFLRKKRSWAEHYTQKQVFGNHLVNGADKGGDVAEIPLGKLPTPEGWGTRGEETYLGKNLIEGGGGRVYK